MTLHDIPPRHSDAMSTTALHHLPASPETCHWGVFDATLAPALVIAPGDRVRVETVSGGPPALPPAGFHVPPELLAIHARCPQRQPGHILTGPIAVTGAEPGDVLAVDVLDVALRQDWAYNAQRPLAGALPDETPALRLLHVRLDAERQVAELPWGLDLPLAPFFGVMGVAPPPAWGAISTIQPRLHGGNIDLKELTPGSTLYLPVHAPGALFSCGDGHAAQGDGEVCVTALETALAGTFRFRLLKAGASGAPLKQPRAETPTHWITLGFAADLDEAVRRALRDLLDLLVEREGLGREDAYTLASIAVDFRVTQVVNGQVGAHAMLAKRLMKRP